MIQGGTQSQKSVFMQLLSRSLNVSFATPTLNHFEGANNDHDIFILDGVSPQAYPLTWETIFYSRTKLLKLLDGQKATFDWGDRGQHGFLKTRNIPVILIGVGGHLPPAFQHHCFRSRLVFVHWEGHCPVGQLTPERIASLYFTPPWSTIYIVALTNHNLRTSMTPSNT